MKLGLCDAQRSWFPVVCITPAFNCCLAPSQQVIRPQAAKFCKVPAQHSKPHLEVTRVAPARIKRQRAEHSGFAKPCAMLLALWHRSAIVVTRPLKSSSRNVCWNLGLSPGMGTYRTVYLCHGKTRYQQTSQQTVCNIGSMSPVARTSTFKW
jgi:hypothetical protein